MRLIPKSAACTTAYILSLGGTLLGLLSFVAASKGASPTGTPTQSGVLEALVQG